MDGWRREAEEALDIGLCRRAAIDQRVGVDERQILTLLLGELWSRFGGALHRRPRQRGPAMNIRYRVELDEAERAQLTAMLGGGKHAARKLKRAQILLAADAGVGDEEIARVVSVGGSLYRTKRRFVEGNLEAALSE